MNEEIEIEKRFARQYRRVAHRHKGLVRFPDEFKSKEQLKKEEQEKGYRYLSNQDADTMVCDGANLICSHCKFSNIGAQDNPYTIERKYEKFIRFNVPDYMAGTFLMGGNAVGTTFCVHADNFDPNPELECQEGGKCAIKAFVIGALNNDGNGRFTDVANRNYHVGDSDFNMVLATNSLSTMAASSISQTASSILESADSISENAGNISNSAKNYSEIVEGSKTLIANEISQVSQGNTNIQSNGDTAINSSGFSVVNGGSNVLING